MKKRSARIIPSVTSERAGVMTPALLLNLTSLIALSGVTSNSTDLDTFTGTIIPDDSTIKEALQALENAVAGITSVLEYDAGNGCRVKANNLGITYSKTIGTGTLSIPSDTILLSARFNGVAADVSNKIFDIDFQYAGTSGYNTDIGNYDPPGVFFMNTTPAVVNSNTPSTTMPVIYETSADYQIIQLSSGNIKLRLRNIAGRNNFTIKVVF